MPRAAVCLYVCLSVKVVNLIQTETFQLVPINLLHVPFTTRGRGQQLLLPKVKGQDHMLRTLNIVVKPWKKDKDIIVCGRIVKNVIHILIMAGGGHLGQVQMLNIVVKPYAPDKDGIVWVKTVSRSTHTCTCYGKRMTPIDFQDQRSRSIATHDIYCC